MRASTLSKEHRAKSIELKHFALRPRGNVILLAVLMLATGIVGGITIALIVVSELRQAKSLDNGLVAYYSAEAGLEESLYNVRQAGYCSTNACNDAGGYTPQKMPPPSSSTNCIGSTTAGCEPYDRQIIPAAVLSAPHLGQNDTFQLDLDPANPVSELQVLWWPADPTLPVLPLLEVSYVVSTALGGTQVCRPNAGVPYTCHAQSDGVCYPTDASSPLLLELQNSLGNDCPVDATFQQIRFKALAADIKTLTIQVTKPLNGTLNNYLELHSRRTYNGVTQALQTMVPKSAAAFGFPDYVIFSEQDITK